jgi:hypothetical protein
MHMYLTWALASGCPPPPLFSLILLYVLQHIINDCYWLEESLLSLIGFHYRDTHNRTERRAQVRPTCSVFEQLEPWIEPQVPRQAEPIAQ